MALERPPEGVRARRMLTVWWEHWPIVAAGAVDRPAVVLRANRVVAASPAALAAGVAAGQRRRVAQQRCPGAELLASDPDGDAEAFEPVVRAVGEFTPRVEVVEPGWLCVEARGPSRYFGGDELLARRITDAVRNAVDPDGDRQHHVVISVADGRFASAVAARLAAGSGRPLVVAPGGSPDFLTPLPIAWLRETGEVDAELVGLFARLGLVTLGELAALDGADVAARFGPAGEHAHRLAGGIDERPSRAVEPPTERALERLFDDPVGQIDPLLFVGKQLADELVAGLDVAGLSCVRLAIVAETEHGECTERVWYKAGGLSAAAIVDRLRWQLAGWIESGLSAGATLLRIEPVELRPIGGDQLRLWGGLSAADDKAVRAVARLVGIAGESAVRVPAWQGGRLPGDRYRWVPATSIDLTDGDDTALRLRPKAARQQVWPGALPAPSPSVLAGPSAADERDIVIADAAGRPVTVSGRGAVSAAPATLTIDGDHRQVAAWAGPWPVDERWWDERRHRRLARFQIVTADGAAYLVALERRRWRILATYG